MVRALIEMQMPAAPTRFRAKELCVLAEVPEAYTQKVLHKLVEDGFLNSVPGPHGGYSLNRPAEQITLLELIQSIEGADMYDHCVLGIEGCGNSCPCPLHGEWQEMRTGLIDILRNTTLAQLRKTSKRLNWGA